jgi:hypothetical protein
LHANVKRLVPIVNLLDHGVVGVMMALAPVLVYALKAELQGQPIKNLVQMSNGFSLGSQVY